MDPSAIPRGPYGPQSMKQNNQVDEQKFEANMGIARSHTFFIFVFVFVCLFFFAVSDPATCPDMGTVSELRK